MPMTTVTREQLYERLWQTPTVHLCKEFGLSDAASQSFASGTRSRSRISTTGPERRPERTRGSPGYQSVPTRIWRRSGSYSLKCRFSHQDFLTPRSTGSTRPS